MKDLTHELITTVNKKFKGHKTKKFEELIEPLPKRGELIEAQTLILIPHIRGSLTFKIFNEDKEYKHFYIPLKISKVGIELGITNKYLQWFLSQEYTVKFLSNISTGTVQPLIPRKTLLSIKIPIPKTAVIESVNDEIQIKSSFRTFIHEYYEQYQFNYSNKRYNTCSILAGIISEAILYQLLLENDAPKKLLDDDSGLGLGKLITYVELMKLNIDLNFETQYFKNINKLRNNAIHFGVVRRSNEFKSVCKAELEPFNNIIKQFGV